MISVGTAPKRFEGNLDRIQRNAIASWKEFSDDIILFVSSPPPEIEGIRFLPVKTSRLSDAPRVDEVFHLLNEIGRHETMMFINTDIIIVEGVEKAVKAVQEKTDNFLVVGQRWDCDWNEPLRGNWKERVKAAPKTLHAPTGIDYFFFPRDFWGKIPAFIIGRTAWDNWLLAWALRQGKFVVDATQCILAVHQNHDWSHLKGGRDEAWMGPEAVHNRSLVTQEDLNIGRIDRVKWVVTKEGKVLER